MTLCRGTLLGPPPTGHVRRFIDSGVFVLPVGGPSRSLLEVRGAPWVALPALICSFEAASLEVLCLIVQTVVSADPGRRKGECVREKEFMTQLPGKNNNNSLTPADARGSDNNNHVPPLLCSR